ncbi:MAG: DUF1573 domain-containing protein [Bacteroidota bacterium]|nr:DUF1573 domain-containing protein [Bacteroidota bacterium]
MKKIFIVLISILISSNLINAQPKIEYNKKNHDFGDVIIGTFPTCFFVFKNTGTEPLKLVKVRTSCGCTTPQWPREEILPGDSSSIKVLFNTRGYKNKDFAKSIIITSNIKKGGNNKVDVLYIKGHVLPKSAAIPQYPLKFSETLFNTEMVQKGKKVKWTVEILNKGDSIVTIKEFKQKFGYDIKVKAKPTTINPGESSTLKFVFRTKNQNIGRFYETFFVTTNLPEKTTREFSKRGFSITGELISKEKANRIKEKQHK